MTAPNFRSLSISLQVSEILLSERKGLDIEVAGFRKPSNQVSRDQLNDLESILILIGTFLLIEE